MSKVRASREAALSANRIVSVALMGTAMFASALLGSPANAGPLTFDEAIAQARHNAPSLRANALGIEASVAARRAAGSLPDPKLSLGIDSYPISGPLAFEPSRDNFTWVRVGVSQDIPNPAKRRAQRSRADADIAVARASTAMEARMVEAEAGVAWISLAFAQKRIGAFDAVRAKLERLVRTTPGAVASGNARPAQSLAGRQSLALLDDRRDALVAEVGRARAQLTRWTGDLNPRIQGPPPRFLIDRSLLEASLDTNPLLAPTKARIGLAAADVRLAEAERKSDFGVEAAYQHRDPRFGDYVSAGVTIGLPFFTRRRQDALVGARQAETAKASVDQEAARRDLAASLEIGLADHAMHHGQWMRSRTTIEPLAQERADLETASYGAGRATLIDVVDAHVALLDATLTTLDREALVAIDGARLALTYGGDAR